MTWLRTARQQLGLVRRAIRTSAIATRLFGYSHSPSVDLVEIDITFACNLMCLNCDRSCRQAPDGDRMSVDQILRFLEETRRVGRRWRRVRLLGGEPTLHPELDQILGVLLAWRDRESPDTEIELVSNGHGARVRRVLTDLPPGVKVKDTAKSGTFQPKFEAFNIAPRDERLFGASDFRHGCWITQDCGVGLNAHGWYPCGVAGGIDRVIGHGVAQSTIPKDPEALRDALASSCAVCGHFRVGTWTDPTGRAPVTGEPRTRAWADAYERFGSAPPKLPRYGAADAGSQMPTAENASARSRHASHRSQVDPSARGS